MSQQRNRNQKRPSGKPKPPLFDHLNDEADRPCSGPPAPLGDMLADVDRQMPAKASLSPRPAAAKRAQRPDDVVERARAAAVEGPTLRITPSPIALPDDNDEHYVIRREYEETETYLHQAELMVARPYLARAPRAPMRRSAPVIVPGQHTILIVIALISIVILLTLGGGENLAKLSRWMPIVPHVGDSSGGDQALTRLFASPRPAGDYTLQGPPSLTADQIDHILASYGSPAAGTGRDWVELGKQYGIDPAIAVAFFVHESTAGTNPAWAGIKSDGSTTHNVGNIICAGYSSCYGRFRDYGSWREGIDDWYRLIDVEYIQGRGHRTIADVIPVYAPAFENDVNNYVNVVQRLVDDWRTNGGPQ